MSQIILRGGLIWDFGHIKAPLLMKHIPFRLVYRPARALAKHPEPFAG